MLLDPKDSRVGDTPSLQRGQRPFVHSGLLEARAATYSGRVLSNAIHALAQIGCPGHIHAVSVLAQRLKDRAGDLTTPELVAAASGMANLGRSGNGDSQAFWDALADEALRRGTEGVGDQALPARAAANLLWALATSGCIKRRGDTAAAVTSAFLADVGSARPQELSMAAWAMAKGHAKDALSMETLAAILEAAVPFLKPSNGRSSAREDAGINQRGWLTRSISDSLGSSPARPEGEARGEFASRQPGTWMINLDCSKEGDLGGKKQDVSGARGRGCSAVLAIRLGHVGLGGSPRFSIVQKQSTQQVICRCQGRSLLIMLDRVGKLGNAQICFWHLASSPLPQLTSCPPDAAP